MGQFVERLRYAGYLTNAKTSDDILRYQHPQQSDGENEDDYLNRVYQWERSVHVVKKPESGKFCDTRIFQVRFPPILLSVICKAISYSLRQFDENIDLQRDYRHRGLQFILKLVNIELTPEQPDYQDGTWHVEGQLVK